MRCCHAADGRLRDFVTDALARGMTESWVGDRTGHGSSTMINRYKRQARTWEEACMPLLGDMMIALQLDPFLDPQRGQPDGEQTKKTRQTAKSASVGHEGLEPSANGLRVHCSTN
jgi:hypothetical protein